MIIVAIFYLLKYMNIPLAAINATVLNAVLAACIYALSLAIVVAVPWWVKKYHTTKDELGITRLPNWMDIGLAPVGFVIYLIISVILISVVAAVVPGLDLNQAQETGFGNVSQYYELLLAFVTLVIIAPVAEEVLFRGYLYGKLRKIIPMWLTIFVVSALFAAVHGQWNVAIDVFALSILLCSLREITGSIWAGVLLHMLKNGLAFYLLFINPSLLGTM